MTTVWLVVNLVNLLQAAGFATRVIDPDINRILGAAIIALGVAAFAAPADAACRLALALALDVSRSVDAADYAVQRDRVILTGSPRW